MTMNMRSIKGIGVFLGVLGAVGGTGAQAADLSSKDYGYVAADMPGQWAGAYIGAGASAAFGGATVQRGVNGEKLGLSNSTAPGGTLFLGYNWQHGSWVAGVEADFNYSDSTQKGTNAALGPVKAEQQDFGALKVRAGYTAGNLLAYGTTGLEITHSKTTATTLDGSKDFTSATLLIGVGLEYAVNKDWRLRAEGKIYGMAEKDLPFSGGARDVNEGAGVLTLGVAHKF
jgi:outer membrane immunogenic protein